MSQDSIKISQKIDLCFASASPRTKQNEVMPTLQKQIFLFLDASGEEVLD